MSWLSALGFGRHKGKEKTESGASEDEHICGYTAVTDRGEQVGSINDYVVEPNGRLRYLIVMLGGGLTGGGRQVAIPAGMIQIEDDRQEVILSGMTKDRIQSIPEYDEQRGFTPEYEKNLMNTYYPGQRHETTEQGNIDYERYREFKTPERIRLLEERIQIDKHPEKMGEVTVGKHVETRQETMDVPITSEHVVIERHPADKTTAETGDMTMKEDTVTIPLYREEVEVTKHPVVAEEVTVRKERGTETRTVSETVSHEELDVKDPQHLMENMGVPGSERGKSAAERGERGRAGEGQTGGKREIKVDVMPADKAENREKR